MATNRLVLRSTASPYTFPLPDIVKGSVLAWDEVDNNFIFLKGLDIRSGSVSGSDLILNRINGDNLTIDLSAFTGGSGTDVFVTGGTYIGNTLEFTNNSGGTFNVTGITSTDYYTTGLTFNSGTYDLTVSLNNGSAFTQSLGILSGDMTITGGTYNPSNGVGTFTNNSGGTFDVTGFLTGYTDTDKFVTGGTYNSSAATITFTNNSGGTFTVTDISGGTSSGVYSQTNNYTSGVTQTINHSAGTTDVLVQIINTNTNELVSGDIDNYQTNSLDVTLSQTLSNIKVVVVGGASGGGGGSTSPAGSNTQIQFNDSGSFGANTGFTFDTTSQTLFTESNVSGTSVNFYNGLSNFDVGFGSTEAIGTTMLYNTDPIGSASGLTMFTMGDLTDLFGTDNTYLLGFINAAGNTNSFINGSPEGTKIMYTPSDGGGGNNNIEVGYGGITNVILSGKTFEVQGVSNTLLNVNNTGTTFHSAYTFPTTDGSLGQVLQTNGGGSVSWATVGGGTGSTSPAGSNTQIQFNDSGSFGANTGFTYSALTNAFSTKSNYGTKSINLGSGVVDMGPFGTLTGITGNRYNNSLSGASANSIFMQGDLSTLGASDNTTFFGYLNQSTNLISSVILDPESSTLNYNTSGNTVQNSINLNATQSQLKRTNNSLNTQSRITLTDSDTEVYFQDSNNSKDAFLDLTADAISLSLNKTGIPSGTTGFYISDTAINANLANSGASQSFSVSNLTPSGWVKRLEVADSGQVTISDRLDIGTSNTNNSTLTLISGSNNEIGSGSTGSVILGGTGNTITSGATISTIISGFDNQVNSDASIIAGGSGNTNNGALSTMVAGVGNTVKSSGVGGGIIGGVGNVLDNDNSWIIGGLNISATTDFTTYVSSLDVDGGLTLSDIFTVSGATTGSGATVPSTVEGFITVKINGTVMLIPYFPVP